MTAINPRLFYDDNKLVSLKIGSGVKTIGKAAFYSSGDDEDIAETIVTMGSNVTSIDNSAFESCKNMKSVTLPQTLTTIGELAFSNSGLTAISIPGAVTTIGSQAFGSTPLTNITLEDGDQPCAIVNGFYGTFRTPSADYDLYLGRNLVYEDQNGSPFPNVTSATIGSKVTSLPHRFFYDLDKLTAVTGAENVATMGTEVYKYCDNLESVELGSALKVLPESTFESCVKLTNLQLPSSLVEIQQWAIYNCQALAELTIPASVQSIGKTANGENGYRTFYQDKGMRRLVIADSDQPLLFADTYGVFFRDMNQLESLYLGRNIVTEGNANQPFTAAREIEFGKGVTDIGLQLSGVTAQTVKAPWQTPITINENAFNQATVTFTSQNYAAGKYDRVKKVFRLAILFTVIGAGTLDFLFIAGRHFTLSLFTTDPEVFKYAVIRFTHILAFQWMVSSYEISGSAMRGMGYSMTPTVITIFGTCVFRIFWVLTLFPRHRDFGFLLYVYPASWLITGSLVLLAYFLVCRKAMPARALEREERQE